MFERDRMIGAEIGRRTPEPCATWAMLLPDAVEGLLSEAESQALDRHIASCPACARELADAKLGAAWLTMLKGETPEPPAHLLGNILEKTTGSETAFVPELVSGVAVPAYAAALAVPAEPESFAERLRRWFGVQGGSFAPGLQPRLAMTAAMAFCSICLTLNLLGLSVRDINASTLQRPAAGLQRTVADTGASLLRSVEGIRVVYRLESRVNEWRTATATQQDSFFGQRD